MSSRDEKVSATFSTRKIAHTGCDTSKAPMSRCAGVAKYVCTYSVAMTPKSTARMLPTNTAKKSSTRERPRRRRYSPCRWNPSGTRATMKGRTLTYCQKGGSPLVTGMTPMLNRIA